MSTRELMQYQAARIEQILAAKGLTVRVIEGYAGHRLVTYRLAKPARVDLGAVQRQEEELALALDAASCRVVRRGGAISVEIPRRDPVTCRLTRLIRGLLENQHAGAVVGVDSEDIPVLLDLASPNVGHVLITGTTGSGKTVLARSLISSLARTHSVHDLSLLLVDPKRRGYVPFVGLPHLVHPIIHDPSEALGALAWAVELMEDRDREGTSSPRLVVCIDELADLMLVAGEDAETILTRLTQRGREAGIHVVACTQKPTAAVIGSLVKANFPARIVGRVTDTNDAYVAAGISGTGAERLLGKGDFIALVGGEAVRLQGAYISEAEICELVTRLRGGRPVAKTGSNGQVLDFVARYQERQETKSDGGRGGHNKKPPTDAMIAFALEQIKTHGQVSQRAVRDFHKDHYGTDCNPRRAQAAIDQALERRNGKGVGVPGG